MRPNVSNRNPSRPIAGAGRVGSDMGLGLLVSVALQFFAAKVGLGPLVAIPGVPEAIFGVAASAWGFFGKVLRDKGWNAWF